jgi:hypothetical protein
MCDNDHESDWHFLFDCNDSRRAWQTAGLEPLILQSTQTFHTPYECLMDICRNANKDTAGKVAMVFCVLWNNRNNRVWNQSKESGHQLDYKSICLWHEWNNVQTDRSSSSRSIQQWLKPQHN